MKYKNVLSRRTLLRGAGGAAVALPFIEEMRTATSAMAAADDPAGRCITMYIGNGLPSDLTKEGYDGPLAPLKAVQDKINCFSKLDLDGTEGGSEFGHNDAGCFTGKKASKSEGRGPSIDQFILQRFYGDDGADSRLQTVSAGILTRGGGGDQPYHLHSWAGNGRESTTPHRSARDLWDAVFEGVNIGGGNNNGGGAPDPEALKRKNLRLRMLDAVKSDLDTLRSPAGNLSKKSREYLEDHFDRFVELENRVKGVPLPSVGGGNARSPIGPGTSTFPGTRTTSPSCHRPN